MQPSKQVLGELYDRWGRIYESRVSSSETYYYRGLTWDEFNKVVQNPYISKFAKEDAIFNNCVVWPEGITSDNTMPGVVASVAESVIMISGMVDAELAQEIIDDYRDKAGGIYFGIKAILLSQFEVLRLTEKDIDSLTFEQSISKLVLCEKIMDIQKMMFNPDFSVPEFNIMPKEEPQPERQPDPIDPDDPNFSPTTYGTASIDDPIAQALKSIR